MIADALMTVLAMVREVVSPAHAIQSTTDLHVGKMVNQLNHHAHKSNDKPFNGTDNYAVGLEF